MRKGDAETERRPGRIRALSAFLTAHPLVVTGVTAGLVAIAQGVAIWLHKHPGAFAGDESMYVADAFSVRRQLFTTSLPNALLSGGAHIRGVPMLSALLMVVGPRDPRTALLALPLLAWFSSVAITAITARFAKPSTAIAAGLAFLVLPTTVAATETYFFGLGVTAGVLGALWALLASDHGMNWRIGLFGMGIAATALTRSMGLAFVPVLVAAGALYVLPDSPVLARRRFAAAVVVGVVTFLPVYVAQWGPVSDYLFSHGYGSIESHDFQGGALYWRIQRYFRWRDSVGGPAMAALIIGATLVAAALWWRRGGRLRLTSKLPWIPVLATLLGGYGVLCTTSNIGDWFDLPLIAVMVTLVAGLWNQFAGPLRAALAAPFVALGVLTLGSAFWLLPVTLSPTLEQQLGGIYRTVAIGGDQTEDSRFVAEDRREVPSASAEWWKLIVDLDARLRRLGRTPGGIRVNFQGSATLLNTHSFELAEEMNGPPFLDFGGEHFEDGCKEPSDGARPTILMLPVGDSTHPGRQYAAKLARRAPAHCWREFQRIAMPSHGDVVLFRAVPLRPASGVK